MALTSLFTETPIEAALWSFAVSLQEKLAESLFQTALFKGVVAIFIGFVIAKGLLRIGTGNAEGGWLSLLTKTLCCLTGLAILGSNSQEAFRPEAESGKAWASKASVQNERYAGLQNTTHGLKFYRLLSGTMNSLSARVSKSVAGVFGDSGHASSPKLLLQLSRTGLAAGTSHTT